MRAYNQIVDIIRFVDREILQLATQLGGTEPVRDQIVYALAELLPYAAMLAGIYLFLTGRTKRQREKNQTVVIITLGAVLIAVGLRWLVGTAIDRPRPFLTYPELHYLDLGTDLVSFPSGHSLLLFTVAGTVYFLGRHPKLSWLLFTVAGVVAVSRVVAGVHYPTDILGGALIGMLLARLITWQSSWAEQQLK